MCQIKASSTHAQLKWSNWLESEWKGVKCYFGGLKGRFRILKLPMPYWSCSNRPMENINNMFFTCSILQNMPHAYDGLGIQESGVDWMGRDGMHNAYHCDPTVDDSSVGMSGRRLVGSGSEQALELEPGFDELRNGLITHFKYNLSGGWVPPL
ncbi:unnamed protein product [Discosporangium mesarthrocarpum]